jgi:hypothetical protein
MYLKLGVQVPSCSAFNYSCRSGACHCHTARRCADSPLLLQIAKAVIIITAVPECNRLPTIVFVNKDPKAAGCGQGVA